MTMGGDGAASLPYWQVNVPPGERELSCPPFLQNLAEKDIDILKTLDDEYHILTWPEVRSIVARNRLDIFQRLPSEMRRYLAYNYQIKQQYGSVMAFVLSQRLGWTHPIVAEAEPFKSRNDLSIKWNDWPYGINEKIVHLVVWTKFDLAEDPVTTDLTNEARSEIDAYVKETFTTKLGEQNVIWFKNWKSLKSIHAVEHFHVMIYDPDPAFLAEITNGDVPLSKRV